jgi:hypothetical protein
MKDTIRSQTTGKEYVANEVVRIVNQLQAASYMAHGAELLDIYCSRDFKTNRPMMVYIFNRAATTPLYDAWCNHTLD